jgi:modulator of FtsH protease HflC
MNKLFVGFIIVIIALYIGLASIFTVNQTSSAIILKLGKIERTQDGNPKMFGPGLHFKIPFVETVKDFDMRLRTTTIDSSRIVTEEQKDVLIDAFIQWRITDIAKFYTSTTGNLDRASNLITQYVEGAMRAEVGKRTIQELINNERDNFKRTIMADVTTQAESLGIQIIDVRIKQIDLPGTVTDSIYQRMRSDREKEASKIRADGNQEAEKIRASADANVTVLLAKASSNAKQIRAQGDAIAAKTYTDAYSKDPEFYVFLRSMNAYKDSFTGKNDVLILKPQGEFFKYFNPSISSNTVK